jgi:hypothetical protein
MFRLICSLLVVLVCVGGYLAFNRDSGTAQAGSNDSADVSMSQPSAPAAPASPDDNAMKDLKVN